MRRAKLILIHLFLFTSCLVFGQGIVNNGAHLVFSGASYIYINGASNGGYLSQSNGIIDPSSTGTLSLQSNWVNNSANTGFSSDNGLVIMNGANQNISGSNSTTFYNLSLQGSGVKTQNINTSVGGVSTTTGTLSVGNVIYDLNSNVLTITNPLNSAVTAGSGYVLSETNAAVNPSIMRWNMNTSTGSYVYPFGVAGTQIPFTFNKTTAGSSNVDVSTRSTAASDNQPWAGASNVGAVGFFYCPNNSMSANPCAANSVIDRWWDITPSAAVTANVTFSYRGSENTLTSPYDVGNIGAQWWDGSNWNLDNATTGSAPAVSSGVGNVTANSLSQFCPFVLSSVAVPLPVEITQIDVKCLGNGNLISWTTQSESNSKYFIIEKSIDALNFNEVGRINAAGNSSKGLSYSYTDLTNTDNNTSVFYYRLKEIDINNSAKKYNILSTQNCNKKTDLIDVANSSDGKVFISFNSSNDSEYTIKIFDLVGKLLKEENQIANKGLYKMQLETTGLPQSIYLLTINGNGLIKNQKVVINGN